MFLITSAAYITTDLATEYGKIPPTFLPLQNKRLYEHQIKLIDEGEQVVLSLPANFQIPETDLSFFDKHKISIVLVPEKLSLGESVIYVLNVVSQYNEPVRILHGDTLFESLSPELDSYIVSKPSDNYEWAAPKDSFNMELVYAGYFSFSNQSLLIRSITESKNNFIDGILRYKIRKDVKEKITKNWFDFGHANTFYRSKAKHTTERFFNDLIIDGYSVKKSSKDINKIHAEAKWFLALPSNLKRYIPSLWTHDESIDFGYYEIEYLYLSSLADLYVYGKNELYVWQNILRACNKFLSDFKSNYELCSPNIAESTIGLYSEKTNMRLNSYALEHDLDLNAEWMFNGIKTPSLNQILDEINKDIPEPTKKQQTIIHGDFCFSNILYNFRTESIKVIDPRGIDVSGNHTIFGDIRYDIAKLAHSVIGMYDFIIAGHNTYILNGEYDISFKIHSTQTIENIQTFFINSNFAGLNIKEAATFPILIHLFLSMLPLHNDNVSRQNAMIANALRLYLEYKKI
jgi:hypothetical protein